MPEQIADLVGERTHAPLRVALGVAVRERRERVDLAVVRAAVVEREAGRVAREAEHQHLARLAVRADHEDRVGPLAGATGLPVKPHQQDVQQAVVLGVDGPDVELRRGPGLDRWRWVRRSGSSDGVDVVGRALRRRGQGIGRRARRSGRRDWASAGGAVTSSGIAGEDVLARVPDAPQADRAPRVGRADDQDQDQRHGNRSEPYGARRRARR